MANKGYLAWCRPQATSLLLGVLVALCAGEVPALAAPGTAVQTTGLQSSAVATAGLPHRRRGAAAAPLLVSSAEPQSSSAAEHDLDPSLMSITGRVTTLVIRNNDLLKTLDLSGMENLTTLRISNNDGLEKLTLNGLLLLQLKNIIITNNDKLKKIELSTSEKSIEIPKSCEAWKCHLENIASNIVSFFTNSPVTLVINNNDHLADLDWGEMVNLKELRIEGNDTLETIRLGFRPSSDTTTSADSAAPEEPELLATGPP